jgi:hypothetical protein
MDDRMTPIAKHNQILRLNRPNERPVVLAVVNLQNPPLGKAPSALVPIPSQYRGFKRLPSGVKILESPRNTIANHWQPWQNERGAACCWATGYFLGHSAIVLIRKDSSILGKYFCLGCCTFIKMWV